MFGSASCGHGAFGFGQPTLSLEHVGEDVMAEWCELWIGSICECRGCPLLGAAQIARIEECLREVQLAGSKLRLKLGDLLEVLERLRAAPRLVQQLGEVEGGPVRCVVVSQFGLVRVDRLIDSALLLVHQP